MAQCGSSVHQIVSNSKSGWGGERDGVMRASSCDRTKQDAIGKEREMRRDQRAESCIHNRNGQISESDSQGNDPKSPKGK